MAITDPTDITGCVLWLDPSTLSGTHSQGDPVSTWSDSSGQGNDGAASGTARPLFDDGTGFYHGRPSVLLDGSDDRINVAAHASLANVAVTYAAAFRQEDMGGINQWIFNKLNSSAATVAMRMMDDGKWQAGCRLSGSTATFRIATDTGSAESGWVVLLLRFTGTALELYANGVLAASLSVSGNIDTASNGILAIGNHPTTDTGFGGYIGDCVVYNNAISDTDRDDLIAWLQARYPNSEYSITNSLLSTGNRDCTVRTAAETGETDHQMLVVTTDANVLHYTAPTNDPHNWTSQGTIIADTGGIEIRAVEFLKVGSTWYVYVDDSTTNGIIRLYTGSALNSLTQHGSSPILTGSVGDYFRSVAVHEDSGSWVMLMDVRTDAREGRLGHVDRWTSSDGISWTKDAVNSPVISGNGVGGFDKSDITHPHICLLADTTFLVSYSGFNTDEISSGAPHQIGLCTSSDLISFTKVTAKNPIMVLGHGGAFDETFHNAPCIWDDGTNLVCYLTGSKTGATVYQLGYATGPSTAAVSSTNWSLTKQGTLISGVPAYFPWLLDKRAHKATIGGDGYDWHLYASRDHGGGGSSNGIYLYVANGDPANPSNWLTYSAALAAGGFDYLATKPAGNPIYNDTTEGSGTETPCVNLIGSDFLLTYHNNGAGPGQATLLADGSDGVNFTRVEDGGGSAVILNVGNHTGYFRWCPNPFPGLAYNYFGWSLAISGTDSKLARWGSNDGYAWTLLGMCDKEGFRLGLPATHQVLANQYDPRSVQVIHGEYVLLGVAASPASGTEGRIAKLYEIYFDNVGEQIRRDARLILDVGAASSIDETEVATPTRVVYNGDEVVIYQAADASSNNVLAVATGSISTSNAPPDLREPYVGGVAQERDFTVDASLPSWLTVPAGTVSFGAGGLSVSSGTNREIQLTTAIDFSLYEFVEFFVEGFVRTGAAAVLCGATDTNWTGTEGSMWVAYSGISYNAEYRDRTGSANVVAADSDFYTAADRSSTTPQQFGFRYWSATRRAEILGWNRASVFAWTVHASVDMDQALKLKIGTSANGFTVKKIRFVSRLIDAVAPVIADATVQANGLDLVVNITEAASPPMQPHARYVLGFTPKVGGSAKAVDYVERTGDQQYTIRVTAPAIETGNTVTLDYSSASGNVTDNSDAPNNLTDETAFAVTNNSEQGSGSSVAAESGSFTLTGNTADLLKGYVLNAESASFDLGGNDSDLLHDRILSAQLGEFTLIGGDASFIYGDTLAAESGSFSLVGQDVGLLKGGWIEADSEDFSLTGQDASLSSGAVLIAESGEFLLAGQDMEITQGITLVAETGSFVMTGQDAEFSKTNVLITESGTFLLVGQDVTFDIGGEAIVGGRFVVGQVYYPGFKVGQVTIFS